jgi:hypothetical protein
MSGYNDEYGGDYEAIRSAIDNDAPDGYLYAGYVDTATDTAIYEDIEGGTGNLSINGETVDAGTYIESGAEHTVY